MSNAKAKTKFDPNDEATWPEFVSVTGKTVLIALTAGGHSESVGAEPKRLHPRYHARAQALGVVPVALADSHRHLFDNVQDDNRIKDKIGVIVDEIRKMVAGASGDPAKVRDWFTNDMLPHAGILSQRLQMPVSAAERDEAYDIYLSEESEAGA